MTEERKQELRKLLEEAMDGLQIGVRFGSSSLLLSPTTDGESSVFQVYFGRGSLPLPRAKLQDYLQKRWTSYGVDSSSILMDLEFYIAKDKTKSQLLEFIREELNQFIRKDEIRSVSYAVDNELANEFHLSNLRSSLLSPRFLPEHLLKIAIAWGVEKAVSAFDDGTCLEGKQGFFQDIASLEGIVVEKEIRVCKGVRLVPVSRRATFELERYLPDFSMRGYDLERNMGKTLLITDRPMLSIFHNPAEETFDRAQVGNLPFQIDTHDIKFPNSDAVSSFRNSFCQALSLACNSPVQIARSWWFLAEDEIFRPFYGGSVGYSRGPFGSSIEAGQPEIEKAKGLYKKLANPNSEIAKKLQIPINRWIQSKVNKDPEDKIIDLGIALESLYLPKDNVDQLSFQFRLNASWHLGKKKVDREKLIDEFKAIYTLRSKAVHNGAVPEKIKIRKGEEPIATSDFIPKAQKLCRDSIMKILEDGEFPDWNNLILG